MNGHCPLPHYPHLVISDENDVRSLHFGTRWVQGGMRIDAPYSLEFEYVQQMMMWMLFHDSPKHIVQLGLGAGSLTKFCYRRFPDSRVTAIELDPGVIALCQLAFALPANDARLDVRAMDAMRFVKDAANIGTVDILQVDLYDAQAHAPVFGSEDFYQACAACLRPGGIMTVNLFCDAPDHARNIEAMQNAFEAVAWLPEVHDGNIVAIGFTHAPSIDFDELYRRADAVQEQTGLPASTWVDGLLAWMQDD